MKLRPLILILTFCSVSLFAQKQHDWIHFEWHGDSIFGKYYPKVAISIPLKIEQLPYNFCGQLDLGAIRTMIYENSFRHFAAQYPWVIQKLDTPSIPYVNGQKCYFLKGLLLQLDQHSFGKRNIVFVPQFGDEIPKDSINTTSQKLIGTIAPDLFQGKILVIDFPQKRLRLFDQLPKQYSNATFTNALIRNGRVKFPITIRDSTVYVMFDTGNCLGDLLLDKEIIKKFTLPNEEAMEYLNGKSWGQSITIYSKKVVGNIMFNNRKLPVDKLLFTDQDRDVQFDKEEKIIGLIGPVLFSNNIVIIDYRKNRFGIL